MHKIRNSRFKFANLHALYGFTLLEDHSSNSHTLGKGHFYAINWEKVSFDKKKEKKRKEM